MKMMLGAATKYLVSKSNPKEVQAMEKVRFTAGHS
jgi:hypothetical protein